MVSTVSRFPSPDELDQSTIEGWLTELEQERRGLPLPLLRKVSEFCLDGDRQDLHTALSVADILHELEMDDETLAAAVIHIAHIPMPLEDIAARLSETVAAMLDDLSKIGAVAEVHTVQAESIELHAENLRRMLLTIAEDVRVVVIILAERLYEMRLLRDADDDIRRAVALETREIHAPLANRLGIWRVKWELEDYTLRYLEPDEYKRIATQLNGRRAERETYIEDVINLLKDKCREAGVVADIVGRPKHIYSIWRKMRRKGVDIDGIFDLMAVRVLVETEADCYTVLGFVHGEWRYIPGEFDDYITTPKANMYRSLHTAVIGPQGKPLEVQIRTREMDEHAERGVAAHWAYKENRGHDAEFQRRLLWMRHWLELKEEVLDDDQSGEDPQARETLGSFVQHFKDEFHPLHVYVLTPQGNVIELPHGSTPVDFAYAIHSDVGHRCRGAKVNGRIVPLTHHLESSTTVEILTAKKGGPSRDWLSPHLSYLKTARARNRVRQWFRQQDYDQHVQVGRHSLNREIERLGIEKHDLHEVLDKFNFNKVDDLLAAIGCGEISPVQVANNFVPRETRAEQRDEVKISHKGKEKSGKVKGKSGVVLEGVDDLMYSIARCCKPVPYDPIVGFITRGRGVTVHRQDCTVIKGLPENERNRLIEAAWSEQPDESIYSVDLHVIAGNRKGLLRDISSVFTNEDVDVLAVSSQTNKHEDIAEFRFVVEVKEMSQLSRVLAKIAQLPDILKAHRV